MRARGIAIGLLGVSLSLPIWAARTSAGPEERAVPVAFVEPERTATPSASSVADAVAVSAASLDVRAGGRAYLPIVLRAAHGVGALQLEVAFDPAVLELDGVVEGGMLEGARFESKPCAPGRVRLALAGGSRIPIEGTFCVLSFCVKGAAGSLSPVTIADARAWPRSSTQELRVESAAGVVRVVGAPGDGHPTWLPIAAIAAVCVALVSGVRSRRRHPAPR